VNGNKVHTHLLTLWDKAVLAADYDKRQWERLQAEILHLEARVKLLRMVLVDTMTDLQDEDDEPTGLSEHPSA